jgi:hypothetical protein
MVIGRLGSEEQHRNKRKARPGGVLHCLDERGSPTKMERVLIDLVVVCHSSGFDHRGGPMVERGSLVCWKPLFL